MTPAATSKYGYSPNLIRAKSSRYPSPLPFHYRTLGWIVATIVSALFYLGPLLLALPPVLAIFAPKSALVILLIDILLVSVPASEWKWARHVFQLLYDLFDVHHNLLDDGKQAEESGKINLSIVCMHPHGVIPLQGYLWVAVCDQFLNRMYGYGGVTDIAMSLPLLRNVLGWIGAGSANRRSIRKQLDMGRNLYMMPGGVAEIFLSEPGTNRVKAKRRGLMKMALQTGSCLIPVYVFGGNDFFQHLATFGNKKGNDNKLGMLLEQVSRSMKGGFTLFWGQYGLPIPYPAKVSMVLGDPIWPDEKTVGEENVNGQITCRKVPNPTDEEISDLMDRYSSALERLFDQYKKQAGCPDAKLEMM